MGSAFDWLGELFRYIGSFIPRPFIVTAVERGVKFKYGKDVEELKPGFHVYWPLVTKIVVIPVVRQSIILSPSALTTRDKEMVSVGVTLVYEIEDAVKALTLTDNISSTVTEVGQTAVPPAVLVRTLDELLEAARCDPGEISELNEELTEYAKSALEEFGIRVIWCRVGDCTKVSTIQLLADSGLLTGG